MTRLKLGYDGTKALLWFVPGIAIEALLYLSYGTHDAATHWLTHFLVGASTALIAMAVWTYKNQRLVSKPLLWVLLAHLFAMLPDFLFNNLQQPHERWMDVFLAHIASHFIPGRNFSWLAIFAAALAMYLIAVDKRVKAT